jgi:hypothetical protein
MATAKDIRVAPISCADARALVRRVHYSGKVTNNSQLHFGVFLDGRLEGAMQFGPSLDKRKIQGLVRDTGWNDFLELNRMAFSDRLPRNSESRAIGIAMRLIRKHYPHIEWVISFADGTQCGDGTIYRASGFVLTAIKKNDQIWAAPEGETFSRVSLTDGSSKQQQQQQAKKIVHRVSQTKGPAIMHAMSGRAGGKAAAAAANSVNGGAASMKGYAAAGFKPLEGYQLRYIYFLNPQARERLTVPILPFSKIEEMGAGMYRGEKVKRGKEQAPEHHSGLGGATPTTTLQASEAGDAGDQPDSGGATPTRTLQS